jgi:DNA-binding response OmpR family regulator
MQNILIVEDEKVLGNIYKNCLSKAGFTVELATSLKAAEGLAKDFPADLILLDHGLPDTDRNGIDAIPDLKKIFSQAKIILFSNYSLFDIQKRALAAGADDCWMKLDMKLEDLVKKVQNLAR